MPDFKVAYIDPQALLGALTVPKLEVVENLGPSGPHDFDDDVTEAEIALPVQGLSVNTTVGGVPSISVHPGKPPILANTYYTDVLNELWAEFDDPEERTTARLSALLEEVTDEAQRVHLLAQDVWDKFPNTISVEDNARYNKEFVAYLRRLQDYKKTLADLEPDSTATDSVYIGLVKRREGAGPLPDAVMHLYFAEQLGILSDHAQEMSESFIGRVKDAFLKTGEIVDRTKTRIDDAKDEAKADLDSWWDRVTRPWKIAGGVLLGAVAVVGTVLIVDKVTDDRDRERSPWQ